MPQLDPFAAEKLDSLPEALLQLIQQAPLPDLDDGPGDPALAQRITDLQPSDFGTLSPGQQALCLSGMWLLVGELDQSHSISQNIESPEGSFWHGIMHRREGDFGNAKYWFRRVGPHPVFEDLPELTDQDYDDPVNFVDQCSQAVRKSSSRREDCRRAQWVEWQRLLVHCLC
ncbi:MAG: hypothetical protein P1U77_06955 [Rubripirellula sp.]|nr:hypothetical protein [Rubripirellula sp.]